MAEAVERCVHCGFCLATCPTYLTLGEEMDSPRGRIVLMKEALEGSLDLDETLAHVDPCLGCVACETSCPSGVAYGALLEPFREYAERRRGDRRRRSLERWILLGALSSPARFRFLARCGRWAKPVRSLLPGRLGAALDLLPRRLDPPFPIPPRTPARGPRRARVVLLTGCAQQVLAPDIHRATIEVLSRNGVEVLAPAGQGCCGALALHAGDSARARRQLQQNLAVFLDDRGRLVGDSDALVTNAAGCGSGLREAGHLFAGEDEAEAADSLSSQVLDVSVFLDELGLVDPPPAVERPLRIAYQDACHLLHAQRVREAPRRLLAAIPGVELTPVEEAEVCCGSAGTYNLEHPAIAGDLGHRKARRLVECGADLVASGNIGCLTQIEHHLDRLGTAVPARHTFQVLRDAYSERLITSASGH